MFTDPNESLYMRMHVLFHSNASPSSSKIIIIILKNATVNNITTQCKNKKIWDLQVDGQ